MINPTATVLKKLSTLVIVVALLFYGKALLMPLATGGIFAMLFLPVCKWLEEKKVYKGLAAFICLLLLLIVITGVITLLSWGISKLSNDFSLIKQKIIETGMYTQQYIYNHLGISVERQTQILKDEQPSITAIIERIGSSFSYFTTDFILILAYVFFLLFYRKHIHQFILKLSGNTRREEMAKVISSVTHVSQQYLLGLIKMIVCLWIMYAIAFTSLGVKNAIFFAILCGLLEIVPFIGNITGTTLTVLVSAMQGGSFAMLGGIVISYLTIQFIQGWVLEPLIVGRQVKINPLFIIIALVLGEMVWGIAGIFLAIPLTAMFKAVCDYVEPLRPYGFLIGETEQRKLLIIKKQKTNSY